MPEFSLFNPNYHLDRVELNLVSFRLDVRLANTTFFEREVIRNIRGTSVSCHPHSALRLPECPSATQLWERAPEILRPLFDFTGGIKRLEGEDDENGDRHVREHMDIWVWELQQEGNIDSAVKRQKLLSFLCLDIENQTSERRSCCSPNSECKGWESRCFLRKIDFFIVHCLRTLYT